MALVSAIIPAYNGASRYVDQAIRSAQAQTITDVEVIVVDDASQDNTPSLLQSFSGIRCLCRSENGGQAVARNDGAALASGTYLAFLDQDDLWEPNFLEESLEAFHSHPDAALVHTDGYQVSEKNEILEYDYPIKWTLSITQILRDGHDTATSGSVVKKECFEAIGGYDPQLTIWEDIDLGIRLHARFPLVHLPKPLYRHRLYAHNASRGIPSERALVARHLFLSKHTPRCEMQLNTQKALVLDWAHYFSDVGKWRVSIGDNQGARKAFIQSLRYQPWSRRTWFRLLRTFVLER